MTRGWLGGDICLKNNPENFNRAWFEKSSNLREKILHRLGFCIWVQVYQVFWNFQLTPWLPPCQLVTGIGHIFYLKIPYTLELNDIFCIKVVQNVCKFVSIVLCHPVIRRSNSRKSKKNPNDFMHKMKLLAYS